MALRTEAIADLFQVRRARAEQRDEVESTDGGEDELAPSARREGRERVVGVAGSVHAAIIGDPRGVALAAAAGRRKLEPAPGKLWYNSGATRGLIRSGEVVSQ